jgi:hypothetical protein
MFLQAVRLLELRNDKNGQPETLQFKRNTNCEAALMQITGTEAPSQCEKCESGFGKFTSCVITAVYGQGSCVNCHYNSMGTGCSFRDNPAAKPATKTVKNTGRNAVQTPTKSKPVGAAKRSRNAVSPVATPSKKKKTAEESTSSPALPVHPVFAA